MKAAKVAKVAKAIQMMKIKKVHHRVITKNIRRVNYLIKRKIVIHRDKLNNTIRNH
jgi:hypothetical protein